MTHTMHDTRPLRAIETRYNGYKFRSRTEARWAVFFDTLGIRYEYEKEGFDLGGVWYLPDFWLPAQECWLEVKGQTPTDEECARARLLAEASSQPVHILWGDMGRPERGERGVRGIMTFDPARMQRTPDRPRRDDFFAFCVCPRCGCAGLTFCGAVHYLPCQCLSPAFFAHLTAFTRAPAVMETVVEEETEQDYWELQWFWFCRTDRNPSPLVRAAYDAARQARFEHGEQP